MKVDFLRILQVLGYQKSDDVIEWGCLVVRFVRRFEPIHRVGLR